MKDTKQQFEHVIAICRDLFSKKLHDYGPAWRILRPASVTDQIFIKANRIRSLEIKGVSLVGEGIRPEFMAIVNYGIIGLIQLELGYAETDDMTEETALAFYDKYAKEALELMLAKNHDYDEAWRSMRITSYTDLILMKLYRTKQIEALNGETLVSEGIDANYMDMINYSVFGLIKLEFGEMKDTKQQFEHVIAICRDLFSKKLHDYGPAWRILRPASVTDQIFIKANRIRSLEIKGVSLVGEGIRPEFMAIVNYGIIGLIQLELGYAETDDMTEETALAFYDKYAKEALELMLAKNHDYDEAWRSMRITSYTDLILMKLYRTKQIEALNGETLVSEGIDANYMDMINYSVFGLIKLEFGE